MQQLNVFNSFSHELAVPYVQTQAELAHILREVGVFGNDADVTQSLNELSSITGTDEVGVGIKRVLLAIKDTLKNAGSEAEKPVVFAEALRRMIMMARV